jgi:prefoldin subunit 5
MSRPLHAALTLFLALPAFAGAPSRQLEAYVYVREGRQESCQFNHAHGLRGDLRALKAKFGDAFLWFMKDHQGYVIKDGAALAKVRDLFRPEEALEAREGALDRQEEELDRRQEGLEARQDTLDDRLESLEEREEEGQDIAARRSALEKERAPLDREAKALGQEQEKLAERQRELGREQEKASQEAMRGLEALAADALRAGLALRADPDGSPRKR